MNFDGKRVVVTGADGFIGSHLSEQLVKMGADVKALVYYNSFNSFGNLNRSIYLKDMEVVAGDIRDSSFCRTLCKNADIILNLAALISIPYSYISPESYVDTNVKGTLNMLNAALANSCDAFLQVSTSEVYGTAQYVPIDEKHPLTPQSPYSASKISAESLALSFYYSFNLPVVVARPFNTYGPRQSARAFIPTVITQLLSGKSSIKMGNLTPTRDLNYVIDTCKGMLELSLCKEAVGEVTNIGSNFEISIGEVVEKIKKNLDLNVNIIIDETRIRPTKSEVMRLWCDNSKIHKLTGFVPDYSINEGLSETINWFKTQDISEYKVDIYNV